MMGMADNRRVSAIIAAGGRGTRMNLDVNKVYIEVGGSMILARTLLAFENCPSIDEIILVVNSLDIPFCTKNIIEKYKMTKIKSVVAGGNERQQSVWNGLREVSRECDIVVIHDGARPFISQEHINKSIEYADTYGAACVAVPVKDTIKTVNGEGFIDMTLKRSTLWAVQTPQTFRYSIIAKAHEKAQEEGFTGTDDASLVERLGCRVKIVEGSYENIKITTREDLIIAEAIARNYR